MRIGLNLLYLLPGEVGGTATYAAGLLAGLTQIAHEHELVAFVNAETETWPLPPAGKLERVICPVRAVSRFGRYAFEQLRLPALLRRHHIDLVHSLGYVGPLWPGCRSVVTVPDLNYLAFGRTMPVPKRMALGFFVRQAVRRSDHVITISKFARGEIERTFGPMAQRLTVTHLAPHPGLAARPATAAAEAGLAVLAITHPFIVAFSSVSPHKNIPRLIEAFKLARARFGLPHQLVLVGHHPGASGAGDGSSVLFTGYLEEANLAKVLSGADLLVFPSTYEGFGLPVLEAMAAGLPVACSDRASLPEVAAEAAAFFDPDSVEDMAQRIAQVALDPALRNELRQKGYENVKRFSWQLTAQQTLRVYQTVLAQAPAKPSEPTGAGVKRTL
jgi:glycosyltransferase involved in cell wall biosynthesis